MLLCYFFCWPWEGRRGWSRVAGPFEAPSIPHHCYPPPCESNAFVRATVGVVSATFGTVESGGSFFWWSMTMKFFL